MSNPQLYQDPILPQHYSHIPITHTAVSFTWPGRDWTKDDMDSIGTQKLLLLYWVRGVSKQIHICLASTDHSVRDGIVEWRARRLHIPFRATPHSFHNKAFPRTVTFVCCTDFCARARASSCRREEEVVNWFAGPFHSGFLVYNSRSRIKRGPCPHPFLWITRWTSSTSAEGIPRIFWNFTLLERSNQTDLSAKFRQK